MTSLDRRNDVSREEAVSAALLAGFLVLETRTEAPLLPLRLFRLRTLAGSNAVGLLLGATLWVSGLTGLAAVPVTFLFIRRRELARAAATALQREALVSTATD